MINFNLIKWASRNGIIVFSLLLALLGEIVLLPTWLFWLRPHFVLLVLIYWALKSDAQVSVGIAFCLGIVLDLLTGSILGEHALAFTLLIYFIVKYRHQIKSFSLALQSILILGVTIVYLALIFWIQGAMGQAPHQLLFCLPLFTNVIVWTWFFSRLNQARHKIGIY